LGSGGTLAVPTHTYSYMGKDYPPFDHANSVSRTGAFTEAVRKHRGALRSGHASHSSAAIGKFAAYLTENHDPANALGNESPLYRVYALGGKVLLMGVTQKSNTMLHLAEELSGVKYTELCYDETLSDKVYEILPDGSITETTQLKFPGCSGSFNAINESLTRAGAMNIGKIGNADSYLINARAMVDIAVAIIKETPDFFLCRSAGCPCCPRRREYMKK